jgi:hypothetical protein
VGLIVFKIKLTLPEFLSNRFHLGTHPPETRVKTELTINSLLKNMSTLRINPYIIKEQAFGGGAYSCVNNVSTQAPPPKWNMPKHAHHQMSSP